MKRKRYPMPEFVQAALISTRLKTAYLSRPAYQQNDYVGWIIRAKREETRSKRLQQMLDELRDGGLYMKMTYRPKKAKSQGRFDR